MKKVIEIRRPVEGHVVKDIEGTTFASIKQVMDQFPDYDRVEMWLVIKKYIASTFIG